MYGTIQAAELPSERKTSLQDFHSKFESENNSHATLIYSIEDALHRILNKRVPVPCEKESERAPIEDFLSGAELQLQRMRAATYRLEAINKHLAEII